MTISNFQLLLADDDQDDCLLFSEALNEVTSCASLGIVHDGEELLNLLVKCDIEKLPDLIFLDLNMPKKNGQECLTEIRKNALYQKIPIIIISTSFDPETANKLYNMGADHYIRKPSEFADLKNALEQVLSIFQSDNADRAKKDKFILLS